VIEEKSFDEFVGSLAHTDHWNTDIALIGCMEALGLTTKEDVIRFVRHDREEKSLKRALYEKIAIHEKRPQGYNYWVDFALCRTIKDPNLLTRAIKAELSDAIALCANSFLEDSHHRNARPWNSGMTSPLSLYYRHAMSYDKFDAMTLERFFGFLVAHYGEKRVTIFLESEGWETLDMGELRDFLLLVSECFFAVQLRQLEWFVPTELSTDSLFCRFLDLIAYLGDLKGPENLEKPCDHHPRYFDLEYQEAQFSIQLPHYPSDYILWSKSLNNCLVTFRDRSFPIFGIFQGESILGAIELKRKGEAWQVVQVSGASNKPLKGETLALFHRWCEAKGISGVRGSKA